MEVEQICKYVPFFNANDLQENTIFLGLCSRRCLQNNIFYLVFVGKPFKASLNVNTHNSVLFILKLVLN